MLELLIVIGRAVTLAFRGHRELVLENLALRQQLIVMNPAISAATWLASIISRASGPISSRMMYARRTSSSIGPPTFIFIARQPSAHACCVSALTCSSE
jgi:hypothetical protein